MLGAGFVNADAFLRMVTNYRVVWLSGRFGGGKTSLGVWLVSWLIANRYAAIGVSNIQVRGYVSPPPIPLRDAALLLDESWMYVDSWDDVKAYAAFLRKMNLYLIMPSVWPPHPRLRILECHRVFNGRIVGLPLWVYRWSLGMASIAEKGYFGLWYPERVFGFYDTEYIPKDDGGIMAAVSATMGGVPGVGRYRSRRKGKAAGFGGEAFIEDAVRRIEDASERFEAARRYASGGGGKR